MNFELFTTFTKLAMSCHHLQQLLFSCDIVCKELEDEHVIFSESDACVNGAALQYVEYTGN